MYKLDDFFCTISGKSSKCGLLTITILHNFTYALYERFHLFSLPFGLYNKNYYVKYQDCVMNSLLLSQI